jgi:hypothetical protein
MLQVRAFVAGAAATVATELQTVPGVHHVMQAGGTGTWSTAVTRRVRPVRW